MTSSELAKRLLERMPGSPRAVLIFQVRPNLAGPKLAGTGDLVKQRGKALAKIKNVAKGVRESKVLLYFS